MASQEESPFRALATSWPALAAFAVTALSFLAGSPRLQSPRPGGGGAAPKLRLRVPEVPVRLWQDPLGSVVQGPDQNDTKWFANNMPKNAKKVLVLLALIESDLNPEQAEVRRRERYAILSALNTAGYVPTQPDRLTYVDLAHPPDDKGTKRTSNAPGQGQNIQSQFKPPEPGAKLPVKPEAKKKEEERFRTRVPFEWARPLDKSEMLPNPRRGEPHYQGVCVVWVYEDIYLANSLNWLMYLKHEIQEGIRSNVDSKPVCEFAITGRIVSGRLKTIINDDQKFLPEKSEEDMQGIPLFVTNSTSTLARELCGKALKKFKNRDGAEFAALPKSKLQLKFVIGTDDLLLQRLVAEMRNRRIDPAKNQIAVISEWDTGYGRDMHREFLKAAGFDKEKPANVHFYSYLRGIDGKLPVKTEPEGGEEDKPAKGAKAGEPAIDRPAADNAQGDPQLDYLRRLVRQMRAVREPYRAVGILGSDPYDKLLILKALRDTFPQALFFTTDLDVRLLQPAEAEWTRNLVVASHFGLRLKDELQDKILPFRSSYDTASYLGCLMAVRCSLLEGIGGASGEGAFTLELLDGKKVPAPVRLYEVGRFGAFELTIHSSEEDPLGARNWQRDREYFEEHRWHLVFAVIACLVLLGLLLLTISRAWQRLFHLQRIDKPDDGDDATFAWRGPFGIVIAIAAGALTFAIVRAHYAAEQEPFTMVDGISIWPTVLFRLFAIGLAVYYILKAQEDLADRDAKIEKEYFAKPEPDKAEPPAPDKAEPAAPSPAPEAKTGLSASIGMWFWNPDHDKDTVATVWEQFKDFGLWRNRFLRYLFVFTANVLLFLLLHWHYPWSRFRGRGDIGHWSAVLSLYVAGFMLVSLLIFVVDTTVLCYRFVSYLSRYRGEWPAEAVEAQAKLRGLTPASDAAKAALNQLTRMRLIAAATRVVSDLIFYPFVVLFVLFVAQNPLFVTWQWNVPALTIAFLSAGAALACAAILQRSAKEAQRKALDKLDDILLPFAGKEKEEERGKLQQIRDEIEAMDSGVFAGLKGNPLVYAILLPLGGGGGLAALEALLPHL